MAATFERTPPYPGYPWTRNGAAVKPEELGTIAGPAHCEWQEATMLFIGWPPGTLATGAQQSRQYIRDPKRVMDPRNLHGALVLNARVPPDASPTGYRLGRIEVYVSPSDADGIYMVGPRDAERWPRSDPMTLCQ